MSEKTGLFKSKSSFIFVALTLVGIGFAAGMYSGYNNATTEQIIEAQDEDRVCHDDAACQNWLNDNYVSKNLLEFEIKKIKDAIAHPHTEFTQINSAIAKLSKDTNDLKLDVTVLKLQKPTTPTTPTNSDFDLVVCEDVNCVNEGDRFKQGETVYIQGKNPTSDRQLGYEIRDPDNKKIQSGDIGVVAGSSFTLFWIIPDDAEDGRYTMIVEIDREEDEIDFIIS